MAENGERLTYAAAGVDYARIDPTKALAAREAAATAGHLARWGLAEVAQSRGSTAFVWDEGPVRRAFVLECLGTKSLVADAARTPGGRTYYDALAQDTVAMVVNDIAAVGAEPQVITAYWAVGGSDWFADQERAEDLARGWAAACTAVGATWGGGETPALAGVVTPGSVDLAGACVGIIQPPERLVLGDRLTTGDAVVLLASTGIHANGISLARSLASSLRDGYATDIGNGTTLADAVLIPTALYPPLLADIWAAGIDVHYLSNITGHGWRKLMRSPRALTYRMHTVPPVPPVLEFIVQKARLDAVEAYGSLNMGAGYAVYVPAAEADKVVAVAAGRGVAAWVAGTVEEGPRGVVVEPVGVTFGTESLTL